MQKTPMTEKLTLETAIAYRSFEVAGKPDEKVDVLVGKPELFGTDPEEWICRYRIVGAGKDLNFQIHGIDSVQVLQLVWKVIDATIVGADLELLEYGEKFAGFAEEGR